MTIVNQKLWDTAPEGIRQSACAVMIGASTARILLYFPPEHPQYGGNYKISWLGPRPDAITVATNLETWLKGGAA